MADRSAIEWTDSTFNPWVGCTKVSPACDNCYAEISMPSRTRGVVWGAGKPRQRTSTGNWKRPLQWNAEPYYTCSCGYRGTMHEMTTNAVHGCGFNLQRVRRRVFCASLADVFDNDVDPTWRIDLLHLIAETPNLDWLLLTKRIGNAERMLDDALDDISGGLTRWQDTPWPNVWLGATICNQAEADRDIPKLLRVPAAVRFLSIEPMLEPITVFSLDGPIDVPEGMGSPLHWVIAGGESGPHARPMHPAWVRSLRDQCFDAGVPFLFKQWGEWLPSEADDQPIYRGEHRYLDGACHAYKVGKKAAGRVLDGITHDGYPEVRRAHP